MPFAVQTKAFSQQNGTENILFVTSNLLLLIFTTICCRLKTLERFEDTGESFPNVQWKKVKQKTYKKGNKNSVDIERGF